MEIDGRIQAPEIVTFISQARKEPSRAVDTMNKPIAISLILLSILPFHQVAIAAPDEVIGRVITIVSGDSFGIELESADPRAQHIDSVKLADVVSASTITPEGKASKAFTETMLKNKTVYLDIDDNSSNGRNEWGQLVCVVYLMDSDSRPVWPCFNRMIVDYGYARLSDSSNNEFNATTWWWSPTASLKRETKAIKYEKDQSKDMEASILKRDSNSKLISIGYRRT
jgi:endonuclease YncB( thermonuclease family)